MIFVSYDFEDRNHFENITDALDDAGLEYWRTADTRAGQLLSEQLHDAIRRAALCVFIATGRSVRSSWCNAELGAFWGAGKRVLIFLADDGLAEDDLPPQFRGHFLQRRIKGLVGNCADYLAAATVEPTTGPGVALQGVSRDELAAMIEDAIVRSSASSLVATAFLELDKHEPVGTGQVVGDRERRSLEQSLRSFVGLPRPAIDDYAPRSRPHAFSMRTSTGDWKGYARTVDWKSYNYVHTHCLLVAYDEQFRVRAAAVTLHFVELDRGGEALTTAIAVVGVDELGEPSNSGPHGGR